MESSEREPSYYEVALTHRQVLAGFVILLACLFAAFFSGIWMAQGSAPSREAHVASAESVPAAGETNPSVTNVAVSVELSPEEARQIAERLLTFANWATQPPVAVDADGEVIPEDDARHPDFD